MAVRDRDTHAGPAELCLSLGKVQTTTAACFAQCLLGTLARSLGPFKIQLFDALSSVGQDQHPVVRDFEETTKDGENLLVPALTHTKLPARKQAEQRRVTWHDPELSFGTWRDNHVNTGFRVDDPLTGHNFDCELWSCA